MKRTLFSALALTALASALLLVPVASNAGSPPVTTTQPSTVTLTPGQTDTFPISKLSVTFDKVISDNRCPKGATCAVAGNAALQFSYKGPGVTAGKVVLNSDSSPKQTVIKGVGTLMISSMSPMPAGKQKLVYEVTLDLKK